MIASIKDYPIMPNTLFAFFFMTPFLKLDAQKPE